MRWLARPLDTLIELGLVGLLLLAPLPYGSVVSWARAAIEGTVALLLALWLLRQLVGDAVTLRWHPALWPGLVMVVVAVLQLRLGGSINPHATWESLRLYLDHWADYVGAPMLAAFYPAWAAWLGDRDLALKLMEEGYGAYQSGRFAQTLEYRLDKADGPAAGPFFANMGAFLLTLLLGLTGVRLDGGPPEGWPHRPIMLPRGWTAIECDRLWVHGRPARLRAEHGAARATLSF